MSVRLSIIVGISAIFFAGLFLIIPNGAAAAPSQPPPEADCKLQKNSSVFPDNTYDCPKNGQPPAGAIKMPTTPVRECVNKCSDGGGAVLLYPQSFSAQSAYCYEIQEERVCRIDGAYTSLTTGQVVTEEEAVEINPKNCGAFSGLCAFLDGLLGGIAGLLNVIVAPLASLLGEITEKLAEAMKTVIEYVISVPISPTNAKTPDFVGKIWNYSRDLANSFFLLMLAIIGLTTILRIQTYQWQKTLPSLVIAVLLINFSGVLVGFVVDMANVVTKALLADSVQKADWGAFKIGGTETLALNVGRIVFYFFIATAYFTTMLLFAVRTVALWIVAAIGPLAFALYVLPATKSYWQQWFKALFQWAIMGIPAAFALFFASKAMNFTIEGVGTGTTPPFFAQVAAPFTAAIILIVGMGMALAGAPAVAQSAVKFGKSLPKRLASTRIASQALGGVAGKAATLRAAGRLEGLVGKVPGIGGVAKYAVRPFSMAEGALGAKAIEYAATKRKWAPPKGWDQMSVPEKMVFSKKLSGNDLVQFGEKMGKDITRPQGKEGDEFRKRILAARDKAARTGYLQESVGAINDIMSETVTEQILIDTKIASGMKEADARKEVQKVMDEHKKKVAADVPDDDLTIEAGIKLKYITRQETETDKDAALTKARASLTQTQKDKFLSDTAAAMSYAKKIKPQDVANVADPKTLSFRLAMRESNPANLQRISDNFDQATLQDIFTGTGGLDNAANTPEKLEKLYETNPRLVRALFTNPFLQGMAWEGRDQMHDIKDRRTPNFRDLANKMQWLKRLSDMQLGIDNQNNPITLRHNYDIEREVQRITDSLQRGGLNPQEEQQLNTLLQTAQQQLQDLVNLRTHSPEAEQLWQEFETARR